MAGGIIIIILIVTSITSSIIKNRMLLSPLLYRPTIKPSSIMLLSHSR